MQPRQEDSSSVILILKRLCAVSRVSVILSCMRVPAPCECQHIAVDVLSSIDFVGTPAATLAGEFHQCLRYVQGMDIQNMDTVVRTVSTAKEFETLVLVPCPCCGCHAER